MHFLKHKNFQQIYHENYEVSTPPHSNWKPGITIPEPFTMTVR